MKKVLLVINGDNYAGAERVVDWLALHLPRYGYEPHIACLKEGLFSESREAQGVTLHAITMGGRLDVCVADRITRLVRDEVIEVIHTHTPRAVGPGALASIATGVPLVHHIHSPTLRCGSSVLGNALNTLVERIAAQRAAALIAVSSSLSEYLASQKFARQRIHVVRNGVPGLPSLPDRISPEGTWTIGVVARFRERKGLEVLLKAIYLLRHAGQKVVLKVVGPFEQEAAQQDMRKLASSLGIDPYIEWVGFTHDVPTQLQTFDLLVLPSIQGEGLPMVILEAMGAGVPIVATAIEGVTEVISDGEDGLLATAGSAEDLADKIGMFVGGTTSWQYVRAHAYQKQQSHFRDLEMVRETAKIYGEVLSDN